LSRACTVAKRCILGLYGTLIGNPTLGIQWHNFRPPVGSSLHPWQLVNKRWRLLDRARRGLPTF